MEDEAVSTKFLVEAIVETTRLKLMLSGIFAKSRALRVERHREGEILYNSPI